MIGLAGYKGSGKDTLGLHLVDHINTKGKRKAFRIGLADSLKVYCSEEYGLDLDICHADDHTKNTTKSPIKWSEMPDYIRRDYQGSDSRYDFLTYRQALQIIGTDLGRDKHGVDIWLERFTKQANSLVSDKPITIVVTDVRFDNEAQYCMDNGGHVIRLISAQHKIDTHITEMGVSRYNYEVEGKGKTSLQHSKRDLETLYGYIELHERVRDFVNEEEY